MFYFHFHKHPRFHLYHHRCHFHFQNYLEGSGSLPDGAFERFVTSAIAAIITIVFSWRLLAEGQEQLGDTNRPRPPRICHEIASVKEKEKEKGKQPALDIPIDEDIQQVESNNVLASAPKYATLTTDCDRKHEAEEKRTLVTPS
jgi:hypothetical protein